MLALALDEADDMGCLCVRVVIAVVLGVDTLV
jgi:hypothetical protein